jgi:putative ABC transport system permease protein
VEAGAAVEDFGIMKKQPPYWMLRFLKWFCPDHLYEEIEGDLTQKFNRDVKTFGGKRAKRRLLWNVIRFFRLGILLRNKFSVELNQGYMLQNYFRIAYRHLVRSKVFSFINVFGLAVGLSAFFLIVQYVSFEMSYDRFYENEDEIYRVSLKRYKNNELQVASAQNFAGLRKLIRENFSDVNATGFYKTPANTGVFFKYEGKIFNELGGELNADSSFFKVFPNLLIKGDFWRGRTIRPTHSTPK